MKIAFLPIDNRPVCYTLAKDIADIDKSIELYIPPREFLGDLTKSADIEKLISWLENLPKVDSMIYNRVNHRKQQRGNQHTPEIQAVDSSADHCFYNQVHHGVCG